jgi:hypothetical protein
LVLAAAAPAPSLPEPAEPEPDAPREDPKPVGFQERHWLATGTIVILLGFAAGFVALGVCWANHNALLGLGLLGIAVLLGTLIGGNFLSNDMDMTTGEVRRAITLSVLTVFFAALGAVASAQGADVEPVKTFLGTFTWIVMTVIGFYFGGRSLERFAEARLGPAGPLTDLAGELVDDVSGRLRAKTDPLTPAAARYEFDQIAAATSRVTDRVGTGGLGGRLR